MQKKEDQGKSTFYSIGFGLFRGICVVSGVWIAALDNLQLERIYVYTIGRPLASIRSMR